MTFKKGRTYAEARRVSGLSRGPQGLAAKVQGETGRYDVTLSEGDEGPTSSCTCESWNKYGPHCKHVVAVALVYLARLRAAETAAPPAPVAAAPEGGADAEADAPAAPTASDVVTLPALAKLETWLGLSSLPDFEFIYRLTPVAQGGQSRQWIIDVRRSDQAGKGPIHVRRTLATGVRIAPADERVFLELQRFEARFDSKLVLNDEDVANLMDLWRERRVIYRGTPLVFPAGAARPQVRLDQRDDGATARFEIRLPDGASLGLHETIVLAGRRTWVLAGQNAWTVWPDFPPRVLRKWLLEPQMTFPPSQVERVLSYFAAHLPRHQMGLEAQGLEVEEKVAPAFVLTVEGNPEKVKAKLAARYGDAVTVAVNPDAQHLGYAGGAGAGGKLFLRHEASEREAGKVLLGQGFRYDSVAEAFEAQGDVAIDFWAKGRTALPTDWKVFAAQPPKLRVRPKVKPKIRVNMSQSAWFELDAEFVTDDQAIDLGAVRLWLDSGRRYLALKDGSFAEADRDGLLAAANLLEEAGAAPGRRLTKLPLFHAPALDLLASLGEVEIDQKAKKALQELREIDGIPQVKAPSGLGATLRHYQEAGLSWLWFLFRHGLSGVLADDMGLGKTIQALSLLLKLKTEHGGLPTLVVAPTSVLANWEREAERFAPQLSVVTWHGADRKEKVQEISKADLVLTSYALIRRDVEQLKDQKFRLVVLDEAQNIKNADSATAQACKAMNADSRLALTGTPLENRLTELWSLFDFLMPGFLGTLDSFHDRFEHPIAVQGDVTVRDRLKRRIHPFVLRRLKTEVAKDLPPKTEVVTWCEMDPAQAALYREVLDDSRRKVHEQIAKVGFNRSRVSILAALMRLRQVCCDPRLLKLPPDTVLPPSAKLERFTELVDDLVAEGHRALVFSQFTEMLSLLEDRTKTKGYGSLYLDGRTKDRMAKVDAFNQNDGPPLFFISLKAGGTGLNLTAADYVIHFDPWWNPAVEDQATDRTHRIGQTRAVFSYKLITKGTVEEKILALQQRKRDLAQGVLGTDSDVGKALTERDVEELFNLEP